MAPMAGTDCNTAAWLDQAMACPSGVENWDPLHSRAMHVHSSTPATTLASNQDLDFSCGRGSNANDPTCLCIPEAASWRSATAKLSSHITHRPRLELQPQTYSEYESLSAQHSGYYQ